MLTKEKLLNLIEWDENELGHCTLFVPLFNKEMSFLFFPELFKKPTISGKMAETVNDILQIQPSELEKVKELIWEECLFSFEVGDYGFTPENGETHVEAHLRGMEISNKEDAITKSIFRDIVIHNENDKFKGRYAEISIDSASDNLISIIIKDGRIIDFDENGCYLGAFDKDELFAKRHRTAVLNQ